MNQQTTIPSQWTVRSTASIAVPLAFTIFLCAVGWFSAREIFEGWMRMRGYHAHGIPMVLLAIHLLWLEKERLSRLALQPISKSGAFLLIACAALWLFSWGIDYLPGEVAGFFALWLFGLCLMFGWQGVFVLGPRLGVLVFTIPIWFPITPILQSISTFAVKNLLQLTGVTAFVEGNFVHVPTGIFEIAGGCSGVGYLLTSLSFVSYIIFSERMSLRGALLYLSAAVVLALVANWLRIFIIILFGYFYGLNHPLVAEHVLFGWVLFAVLFAPAVYFGFRLLAMYPILNSKTSAERDHPEPNAPKHHMFALPVFLICAIVPAVHFYSAQAAIESRATSVHAVAEEVYDPVADFPLRWSPNLEDVDFQQTSYYSCKGLSFALYSAGFDVQPEKRQLVNDLAVLTLTHRQLTKVGSSKGYSIIKTEASEPQAVLLRWIDIGGEYTAHRLKAKLLRLTAKLRGRQDVTINALVAPCHQSDCAISIRELKSIFNTITTIQRKGSAHKPDATEMDHSHLCSKALESSADF